MKYLIVINPARMEKNGTLTTKGEEKIRGVGKKISEAIGERAHGVKIFHSGSLSASVTAKTLGEILGVEPWPSSLLNGKHPLGEVRNLVWAHESSSDAIILVANNGLPISFLKFYLPGVGIGTVIYPTAKGRGYIIDIELKKATRLKEW